MKLRLTHRRGSRMGDVQLFEQDVVRIGRRPDNDVAFDETKDRQASGHHCELFFRAGEYHVRDLESSNGTFVNGERVSVPTPLRTGDELELGQDGPLMQVDVGENIGGTARIGSEDVARVSSDELPSARRGARRGDPTGRPRRGVGILWKALIALLVLGAIAGAVVLLTAKGASAETPKKVLHLATGPQRGIYYQLGKTLERLTQSPGEALLPVVALETSGSVSNVHHLLRGDAEVAIVQADVLHAAVNGRAPFGARLPSVRALGVLYGEVVHVVARAESGVTAFSDLEGKRIAVGAHGSGSVGLAGRLLEAHGVERYHKQLASPEEALARFRAGQVEAFVLVSAVPSPIVSEALAAGGRLVPVSKLKAATLVNQAPYLVRDVVAAGTYPGQPKDVEVVRVDAMLAVMADMRPEVAYEILRLVFSGRASDEEPGAEVDEADASRERGFFEELRAIVPSLRSPDRIGSEELHAVPLHEGAMVYYEERDVFDRPVRIHTGIYTNDIFNLDITGGSFDADFYLWFRFKGRLEPDPADFRVEFMNGEIRQRDPPVIERYGGETYLSYKVIGRFRTTFPQHRFPFDDQVLPIEIEHPEFDTTDLVFVPDDTAFGKRRDPLKTMVEPGLEVGEWRVTAVRHGADEHVFHTDMGSPATRASFGGHYDTYSRYRYEIVLTRELKPYLIKFCVPLVIMVTMAFMVFWIPPEEFMTQVVVGIAALIGCVAFHTTQVESLPRVGYMVTADLFFMIAYATIFLTLLQIVLEHALAHRGRRELALRLDRWARFVFPTVFFGTLGLVVSGSL